MIAVGSSTRNMCSLGVLKCEKYLTRQRCETYEFSLGNREHKQEQDKGARHTYMSSKGWQQSLC